MNSKYLRKDHNVTVLLYHLVFPAKYKRVTFDDQVEAVLKGAYLGIELCYEVKFLEIGTNRDYVHFLVQSVPTYSVTKLVTMIKSLTAREVFRKCPQVRKVLWGGNFGWTGTSRARWESTAMRRRSGATSRANDRLKTRSGSGITFSQ